jgi:hypothetical protein
VTQQPWYQLLKQYVRGLKEVPDAVLSSNEVRKLMQRGRYNVLEKLMYGIFSSKLISRLFK